MLTAEQLSERKLGIGGSDMPIIMGLSKYKTRYQLYIEKTSHETKEQVTNQYAYWGNRLEHIIVEEFEQRNNLKVSHPDTFVHPIHDFMRGNVDGYIAEKNAILEIKCTSQFSAGEWGETGSNVIPLTHMMQVAYYCLLANADYAHIVVLIGGNDYREYQYMRDRELEKILTEEAKKFWSLVQNKQPPALTNECDVKLMYPTHVEQKKISAVHDVTQSFTQLKSTKAELKRLTELEEKFKFELMNYMKDSELLVDDAGKPLASWKANKSGTRTLLIK